MAMSDHPASSSLADRGEPEGLNLADQFMPDPKHPGPELNERDDPASGAWVPENVGQADWSARRALRYRRIVGELTAVAQAELDELMVEVTRLERFIADERARYEPKINRAEGAVTAYHRALVAEEISDGIAPRDLTKTLRLPCGVVSTRAMPGGVAPVVIEDADELRDWDWDDDKAGVRFHRIVPERWEPDKKAIGKALAAGEEVPGCRLAERTETWTIKTEEN